MYISPVGSVGFLADFVFYMAVLGVPSGPIGLVAPLRFKTLDSQPEKSNMGPFWIDFHDFREFENNCYGFLSRYLPHFRSVGLEFRFSSFSVGTKKICDEKLCRFVVVSPREVPYSTFSCPFKIFDFWSFLKAPSICRSQFREFGVH